MLRLSEATKALVVSTVYLPGSSVRQPMLACSVCTFCRCM